MGSSALFLTLTVIGVIFLVILAVLALINAFYTKVSQGEALIVNDMSTTPKVFFTGAMVLPVIHKKEVMQISVITLEIDRRGGEGLICKDNLRADITVAFYLRVNETAEDVLKVAKAIGVKRASDKSAVNELFNAKFSEALKTVGKQMNFIELFENRIRFRDEIIKVIGEDLNGYVLEDVAIDYLEQTPIDALNPMNMMDSEGIRRITEITASHKVETNRLKDDETLSIQRKNTSTQESLLALEKQREEARARQVREIEIIRAREEAEASRVKEEERRKAELARIETDEALAIREENRLREIEVAQQNRSRAVVIEQEKVEKARQLEAVNREREVELQRIEKEKALEEERKVIANTISERISVEKKVAEEEERINDVRTLSDAERRRQVKVLEAQADAEKDLVTQVKAAEAEEQRAQYKAKEINILAQAELEAAAKKAESMKKHAEGVEAEEAASGLASARIKEAQAVALEKEGIAKAKVEEAAGLARSRVLEAQAVALEKEGLAKAAAEEAAGMARTRVLEAQAEANEKNGLADAKVLEEKLTAQAKGDESIGVAVAKAEREKGLAAAAVVLEKAKAEAQGLIEKFQAMNNMTPEARDFEEFRMRLDVAFNEAMASIEANKVIAKEQAEVLAAALQKARIDIVGGGGEYFESFAKSLAVGKAVNGVLEKAPSVQAAMDKLLSLGSSKDKPELAKS